MFKRGNIENGICKKQIIVGQTSGFCYGVKNAVEGCIETVKNQDNVYCLNEVVHNPKVIKELENQGIQFINNIEESKGVTIIRAHGIPKEIYEKAKKEGIELKDFTCPNVLKVHEIAKKYEEQGYYIILCGNPQHPENIGTVSYCGKNVSIIADVSDTYEAIQKLKATNIQDILIISQTTYSLQKFNQIIEILKRELIENFNLIIKNTICKATEIRQKETKKIAKEVEYMIIIGGKNSSNTRKLYEVAKNECENSICVESKDELDLKELKKYAKIGVMAGASTPQSSIDDVVSMIQEVDKNG